MRTAIVILIIGLSISCTDKPPKHVCVFKQSVYDSRCRAVMTNRVKVEEMTNVRDSLIAINANPTKIAQWQDKIDRQDSLMEVHTKIITEVLGSTKCEILLNPVCP